MRLPRDLTGSKLVRALKAFGYEVTRQTGSHMRLTTPQRGEHHLTIPRHDPLRVGTMPLLGAALVGKGDLGAALEELRRASELDPANPQIRSTYEKVLGQANRK